MARLSVPAVTPGFTRTVASKRPLARSGCRLRNSANCRRSGSTADRPGGATHCFAFYIDRGHMIRNSTKMKTGAALLSFRTPALLRGCRRRLVLDKRRNHLDPSSLLSHHLFARRRHEAACGVEYFGEEEDIAHAGQKNLRTGQSPMHDRVYVALIFEWLISCRPCAFTAPPRAACDRLDRQHRNLAEVVFSSMMR
jgi:hypothetical protein